MTYEADRQHADDGHHASAAEIAVGVVIGRTSEFFDFFVYAIASVLVFPRIMFPFMEPLPAVLWSFADLRARLHRPAFRHATFSCGSTGAMGVASS